MELGCGLVKAELELNDERNRRGRQGMLEG